MMNDQETSSCTVANGEQCSVVGEIQVPFQLRDRIRVLDVLVIPSLSHTFVFGTDFWRAMAIVPDLRHGEWNFNANAEVSIIQEAAKLSPEQQARLRAVIENELPASTDKIGCIHLVEHVIKTTGEPIKQRF